MVPRKGIGSAVRHNHPFLDLRAGLDAASPDAENDSMKKEEERRKYAKKPYQHTSLIRPFSRTKSYRSPACVRAGVGMVKQVF